MLTFHTKELPQFTASGARYMVIAICGAWRDGDVTHDPRLIPQLQRKLRKRFMTRFDRSSLD